MNCNTRLAFTANRDANKQVSTDKSICIDICVITVAFIVTYLFIFPGAFAFIS
jgi:hypothetical protein